MALHVGDYVSLYIFKNGYTFGVNKELYKIKEFLNPVNFKNYIVLVSLDGKSVVKTNKNKIFLRYRKEDVPSSQLSFLDELGG